MDFSGFLYREKGFLLDAGQVCFCCCTPDCTTYSGEATWFFFFFGLSFYRTWHTHIVNMHLLKDEPQFCLLDHWSAWLESWIKNSSSGFCSDHPHIFSQRTSWCREKNKGSGSDQILDQLT